MKCVKDSLTATYTAHPDYPKLSAMQLQSFVKRFLGQWNKVEQLHEEQQKEAGVPVEETTS